MTEITENKPPEAYELLDKRDEEQILAEIKGNIIEEMFYSFKVTGKQVTGISWVGTKEIARQYGGIDMKVEHVEDAPESYRVIVKATDTRTKTSLLGTAEQPKLDTRDKPDRFAFTKALSKAQRNAIRAVIPEKFLIEMYEVFKKGNTPKQVRNPVQRKQVKAKQKQSDLFEQVHMTLSDALTVGENNALDVAEKDGKVYIQHAVGFDQKDFNKVQDTLDGAELKNVYHHERNTWEVKA